MDFQLISIILIFVLLFILEHFENKENFAVVRPGYTNTSPFLDLRYNHVPTSINLTKKDREFGNFGTFGSFPANPLCNSCKLQENVVTAPYLHINDLGDESGALYGKVGRSCGGQCRLAGKNYNDLTQPLLVDGRSAGRTRQCRRLL